MLRTQLMSGATSVAHLVGLGRFVAASATPPVTLAAPAARTVAIVPPPPPPAAAVSTEEDDAAAAAAAVAAAGVVVPPVDADAAAVAAAKNDDPADDDNEDKDDDEKELKGEGKKGRARVRERARCRAILNSEHAANNPDIAMQLALQTSMPRQTAIAMLASLPKGATGLDARMARVVRPAIGAGAAQQPGAPDSRAIASAWDAAFAKAKVKGPAANNDTRASWDTSMRAAR